MLKKNKKKKNAKSEKSQKDVHDKKKIEETVIVVEKDNGESEKDVESLKQDVEQIASAIFKAESETEIVSEASEAGKDSIVSVTKESLDEDQTKKEINYTSACCAKGSISADTEHEITDEKSEETKNKPKDSRIESASGNLSFNSNAASGGKTNTRANTVAAAREHSLAKSLEEKRKDYKCGKKFVRLEEIAKWSKLCKTDLKRLQQFTPSEKMKRGYLEKDMTVDEVMNDKISLYQGDMTCLEVDAAVNAANGSLLGGGGIDGAIHSAAGSALLAECKTLGGCETGRAKTTAGYKLPAKYVIHTVGPMDGCEKMLRSCYRSCFQEMQKHNMKSIAFCCISTGIYGYKPSEAVHVALQETRSHLETLKSQNKLDSVDRVVFCLFGDADVRLYEMWAQAYFPAFSSSSVKSSITSNSKSDRPPKDSSPSRSTRPPKTP